MERLGHVFGTKTKFAYAGPRKGDGHGESSTGERRSMGEPDLGGEREGGEVREKFRHN